MWGSNGGRFLSLCSEILLAMGGVMACLFCISTVFRLYSSLGEQLRDLLRQHGTMESVNLKFEKEHILEQQENTEGGWHTQLSLEKLPGWDES